MPLLPGSQPPTDYLGQGFAFPWRVNPQGAIQLSAAQQNVEESMRIILETSIGERVYRPDFGSRLSELTFAPLNLDTLISIRRFVEEALSIWEARIILDEVKTIPDAERGRVLIEINYRLRANYVPGTLIYPFYLMPPEEAIAEGELNPDY
ncbi:GPW/gp25 family protein [Spirulina subsalsa FACHB-351]|uniref:GPW/gp25 family protein n=1 Tax=Spirulina subsalsa FACHB-351 TaxID=234711 RepID=A0ABT3L8L9_9CYAN|nr:GPW/gp25 family protein [Spirulina subsalsa]MCW6037848.1 GPW/gp25 family protein [Spirulina subsalsa FACHB-351]